MPQDPLKIIKSAGGLEKYYKLYDEVFTTETPSDDSESQTKVKRTLLELEGPIYWSIVLLTIRVIW